MWDEKLIVDKVDQAEDGKEYDRSVNGTFKERRDHCFNAEVSLSLKRREADDAVARVDKMDGGE